MVARRGVLKLACMGFLLSSITAVSLPQISQDPTTAQELPQGYWSLVVHPGSQAGQASLPVNVFRVRTHARMGMAITQVGLINRSSGEVIAVKLGWEFRRLLAAESRALASGTTRTVVLSQGLSSGAAVLVSAPFASFAYLLRQHISTRTNEPQGAFSIEISVSEVQFADGGSWRSASAAEELPDQEIAIGEVASLSAEKLRESECPNLTCVFDGKLQCYVCGSQADWYCEPESCLACATGWCIQPGKENL